MKRLLPFLLLLLAACNNEDKKETIPATEGADVNAARDFVTAALKGNFNDTRRYTVKDSTNQQFLDVWERKYAEMDGKTRDGYANASIIVYDVKKQNDSTTIVVYANSFKNDKDTLKVVKENNNWLVDATYLWMHDRDTSQALSDTLRH